MNNKISVIIPIYNTCKELAQCLSSVCDQTYKNLEIICIDDGSFDGSEKILDEFAMRDNRIITIHQKNGGESNARNNGLKIATGEFIAFVDCDDWLDIDMYQDMITIMQNEDVDMVATSWYKDFENESIEIKNELPVLESIFSRNQLLEYIYKRDTYRGFAYMWNKLYRKKVLINEENTINLFDEDILLGGDVLYLAEAALKAQRVKYIDRAYYHYRQKSDSSCHTKDLRKISDWVRTYEIVIELFKENNVTNEVIEYAIRFMAYHACTATQLAIEQKDAHWINHFKRIMIENKDIYIKLNENHQDRIDLYNKVLEG